MATQRIYGDPGKYEQAVSRAREMVGAGRGGESFLLPPLVPTARPILHSYQVFLDKRGPDSLAVPFQLLGQVGNRPVLALRDPADPFPGTIPPAQQQLEETGPDLRYVLLPDIRGGRMDPAAHAFTGREQEVFRVVLDWMAEQGLSP